MGFWQDRKRRAEEARRLAVEEERKLQEAEEKWKQDKREGWKLIGSGLLEVVKMTAQASAAVIDEQVRAYQQEQQRIKWFLTEPTALDSFSDIELQHLRLTTESEIARYGVEPTQASQALIKLNNESADPINAFNEEDLHNRRLLLRLIQANQEQRKHPKPKQAQTTSERRREFRVEIEELALEKADALKRMRDRNAAEEEIRQLENMYDDSIHRKENQLRKLM